MSILRFNKKRDQTEPMIVKALQKAGVHVMRLDSFDLLCRRGSSLYMLECKIPGAGPNKNQQQLIADGWPIHIVHSVAQALTAVGL
jgi:hypothetical protein